MLVCLDSTACQLFASKIANPQHAGASKQMVLPANPDQYAGLFAELMKTTAFLGNKIDGMLLCMATTLDMLCCARNNMNISHVSNSDLMETF